MVVTHPWGRRPRLQYLNHSLIAALSLALVSGCAAPAWFQSSEEADFPVPKTQAARVYPRATASATAKAAPGMSKATPQRSAASPADNQRQQAAAPFTLPGVQDVSPLHERQESRFLPPEGTSSEASGIAAAGPTRQAGPASAQPMSGTPIMHRLPSVETETSDVALISATNPQPSPSDKSGNEKPHAEKETVKVASASEKNAEVVPASSTDSPPHTVKTAVAVETKADVDASSTVASSAKETKDVEQSKPPPYQAGDWLKSRDQAIKSLQQEIQVARADAARSEEIPQLETLLRMHYSLAGRRDDAAKPVDGLRDAEQEFWRHEALGLVDLLGPDRLPSESRRFAVALKSLEEAEANLAAASSLTLRNLALCRKVQDFGVVERFPRSDFKPSQEVLLYVEVRNFAAEENDGRYETELQGSFRVLDRSGAARAERTLPLDKQTCANFRRDYYIAYRVYIPSELSPGAYTLELTIEDKKGNKSNNALLDFNVVQ